MITISSQIKYSQDVPQVYFSEATEFYRLNFLVGRTTSGAYIFTSTSSGVPYTGTGGEQGLYNALFVALQPYGCSANDINAIRSWLWGGSVPIESGYRQKATYDLSGNVTNFAIWTSSAMTTKVAELIAVYDSLGTVLSTQEKYYNTNGTSVLCDYTDSYYYLTNGDFDYADRTVTVA